MIKPGKANAPYEIELIDSKSRKKYGLKIPQGSLQIGTVSQDDTVYIRNVGKRVGDFDEQRNWKAGRGTENLSDNADGYWDSQNAWTLTPGHVHQGLQWYHARGLRNEDMYMPTNSEGDVQFQPLLNTSLYISNSFSASASYSADKAYLWIRRRGTPGTLTLKLHSDNSGDPGTVLQTVTKTVSDITDYVSVYQVFDWTSTESLTASTTYHISVYGASTDDRDNHWEIGVNPDNASGKISSDGATWTASGWSYGMYYRVTDADTARQWFRFYMSGAFYVIDKKNDLTTASKLYINGDRGIATAGASTTLTDSAKSWTADRYIGAYVKITAGTGVGQVREITDNDGTSLTVSAWTTNPSTDSEYIIYGTPWFTEITPSGATLAVCTSEPKVVNNIAYIPQGSTPYIHLKWNSAGPNHLGYPDAGTYKLADFFFEAIDPADGPVLWRANNNSATGSGGLYKVSRATISTSLAYNTNLTFKDAIATGKNANITGLGGKDNQLYVFREDGMGIVSNDRFIIVETGVDKTPSPANGRASIAHGQFVYYSWLHSIVRIYGSSHDDIGDDYRSEGLPDGREGEYADMETYLKVLYCAIDAGTGTSSVLAWDGLGWHEMIRGREAGARIRMVKVQVCDGTRNRLWNDMGGDLVFQELPYLKASPRLDSGARFMHEAVIESAAIDMGAASAMPKFIRELTATVKNLNNNGREVLIDFQTDDDVRTSTWTYAGTLTQSPESDVFLGLENIRRFSYRLRINCNDNTVPIDIEGMVPNGYARTPFKMVFTMQVQAGGIYSRRGKQASSGELMRWLLDSARQPGRVRMDSVYEMAHGWYVVVHPPRQFPLVAKQGRNDEQSNLTLVLQEV